jgi:hypothetical protein
MVLMMMMPLVTAIQVEDRLVGARSGGVAQQ